jgi:DNA-binding MarR family transcriptional regulator
VDIERTRKAIAALIRVRILLEQALYPGCTLIAIDLLLAAARGTPTNRRDRLQCGPTVRELFSQVGHSSRGIRMHFDRLLEAGLLVVEPGRADRRTKTVSLSTRGEQLIKRIAHALQTSLERELTSEFNWVAVQRRSAIIEVLSRRRADR